MKEIVISTKFSRAKNFFYEQTIHQLNRLSLSLKKIDD